MAAKTINYTVSGPGVDVGYTDAGPAISRSVTEALRSDAEVAYYVRDAAGDPVGRSERDAEGVVRTWRFKK